MAAKKKARIYKCKVCDYRCNKKEQEYEHKRKHLNSDKTFACNACPFVTSFKHGLDYHEKSKHLKIKPYHCDKCKYDCVTKSMLKSHLKSHSPECEFVCSKCPYKTHHKHSLNQHVKQRHGSNEFDHIYSEVLSRQGSDSNNGDVVSKSISRSSSRRSSTSSSSSSLSSGATTDTAIDPGSPPPFAPPTSTGIPTSTVLQTPGQSAPNPYITPVAQLAPAVQLALQIDHQKPPTMSSLELVERSAISTFQPLSLIPISAPPQVSPLQTSLQQAPMPRVNTPMVPIYHLVPISKQEPSEILDLRIDSKLRS